MNRNVSLLLALTAALVLPACGGDGGGSLATTPKIDPPPPTNTVWTAEVTLLNPEPPAQVFVGRGIRVKASGDAPANFDDMVRAGVALYDSRGNSVTVGGGEHLEFRVNNGRWFIDTNAFCDVKGAHVTTLYVGVGKGGIRYPPGGMQFDGGKHIVKDFTVDYTCK